MFYSLSSQHRWRLGRKKKGQWTKSTQLEKGTQIELSSTLVETGLWEEGST